MTAKRVLLVEPGYRNKYPPLGLMKLATYHKACGDSVRFAKLGFARAPGDGKLPAGPWDRVYVTTLFSFEWKRTSVAIDQAIQAAGGQTERVFVGGIAASLMQDQFEAESRWAGVRFIAGLLDRPPAIALQLSADEFEFGADDVTGRPIEELIPDYAMLDDIAYTYPVRDAYFGYASRGCVRKCSFCGVPKLEGAQREMPPLRTLVEGVDQTFGAKKDLILMDNNITASGRYREVIAEIRDIGFGSGATLARAGSKPVKRRVDFNQGVDARILAQSPVYLREMATICVSPLRIAFDHMGLRRVYETSIRMAADNGLRSLSNYMLYNFMDTPEDLYERMRLNIKLNNELGIRIWSFPMRYQPVTLKDRSHVGKNWSRYSLRSFQIMLQATHGVVSGNPSYFVHAYGEDRREFGRLLSRPHAFIFYREHYERGPGRAVREEYEGVRSQMTDAEEAELIGVLRAQANPSPRASRAYYEETLKDKCVSMSVRRALQYHLLDTQDQVTAGHFEHRHSPGPGAFLHEGLGEDERVEDAGLFDHDYSEAAAAGICM